MGCDYYIQTELVIEYINKNGIREKTTTDRFMKQGYIFVSDEDSDDDFETVNEKYIIELNKQISNNTNIKILFENNSWVKHSYEKKHYKNIISICPNLKTLIKVYKNNNAFARN
jgi:hypothetical protein